MMSQICLANKTCIPCQGGVPPLGPNEINELLRQLKQNWELNEKGHLNKSFTFNNFIESMHFANRIATLAEEEGHHPDLTISWGLCRVEIWTHKINGLTESDFILAAKIENLMAKY
jgi:4a-hydroxytetrahydrobiopterin dehydratase